MTLPVSVDYSRAFAASDHEGWKAEYLANVEEDWFVAPTLEEPKRSPGPIAGELFEPFGADAEWLQWCPDLLDELREYKESQHGNHI